MPNTSALGRMTLRTPPVSLLSPTRSSVVSHGRQMAADAVGVVGIATAPFQIGLVVIDRLLHCGQRVGSMVAGPGQLGGIARCALRLGEAQYRAAVRFGKIVGDDHGTGRGAPHFDPVTTIDAEARGYAFTAETRVRVL